MKKVITYGTYDCLHFGHIRLLQRAKALGDYLIVGVTSDDFDKKRGKINVIQSLMERIEGVKNTGLADEIIVEEYEGQKIDDIQRYEVDVFTVGSDWEGKFDYLREYCEVVYLSRTEGVSSSEIRSNERTVSFGIIGENSLVLKIAKESSYVNGLTLVSVCTNTPSVIEDSLKSGIKVTGSYEDMLSEVDAVYVLSHPSKHFDHIKKALDMGCNVLCESPVTLNMEHYKILKELAQNRGLVLFDGIKTAYSTAYARMSLLIRTGLIGDVVSIDSTCTSLAQKISMDSSDELERWNSITAWGPTGLLPVFQLLGTEYRDVSIVSRMSEKIDGFDDFTRMSFVYDNAVASVKVGKGVKSEGELVVSGTKGYIYVPAPWWKTDYFEARFEDPSANRRFFYQLDGEGIRYELLSFLKSIYGRPTLSISSDVTAGIVRIQEMFENKKNFQKLG